MHEYIHTKFGFCLWDVGALAALAVVVTILIVHCVRQKKRERDFEEQLAAKRSGTADS